MRHMQFFCLFFSQNAFPVTFVVFVYVDKNNLFKKMKQIQAKKG